MALDAFNRELRRIMDNDAPAKPTTLSRAVIEATIAEISESLKGPLSNVDRLDLVESRRELRKQLAAMD